MARSNFNPKPVRRSQLVSPWGIGAIIPFPDDESLMIAGLDMWRFHKKPDSYLIKDSRLSSRLYVKELRLPPSFISESNDPSNQRSRVAIPAVRFPQMHYCPYCGEMEKSSLFGTRDRCRKHNSLLVPERFIVVCPEGHIDDFPVSLWIHNHLDNMENYNEKTCKISRKTRGISSSLSNVVYECSCGASRSLAGASKEGALEQVGYKCKSAKPWLGITEDLDSECNQPAKNLRVVQRGGTNVWFHDIVSSIYIPLENLPNNKRLLSLAKEHLYLFEANRSNGVICKATASAIAKNKNIDETDFYNAICTLINEEQIETQSDKLSEDEYRYAEYDAILKSKGNDALDFNSFNSPITQYNELLHSHFKSVSLLTKLRETRAFVGFSRLSPNSTLSLSEKKKMLSIGTLDWLPAVSVYGEGVFLEFKQEKLISWEENPVVQERVAKLSTNFGFSKNELNPRYVMLHTFAHLLINQFSFECGYGSSSIRERIYCPLEKSEDTMAGILLYTASGDSEGSYGGLVTQGKEGYLENIIANALNNALWCSSDPLCIYSEGQGPNSCNLAACYSCALLPETCCEQRNMLLDRGLVIGTLNDPQAGYFYNLDNKIKSVLL